MCYVMTTNFEQIFNLDDRILVFLLYDKSDEDTVSLNVSVNRKGKPMPYVPLLLRCELMFSRKREVEFQGGTYRNLNYS